MDAKEFLQVNDMSEDDQACGYILTVEELAGLLDDYHESKTDNNVVNCDDFIHEERVKQNDDKFCPICGKKLQ